MKVLLSLILCCGAVGSLARAATFEELAAQASAARDANDVPRAIELYHQALHVNAEWAEGWWFVGTLAYDADQYAEARDAFSHFVKLQDQAAPGWSLLGLCEFETGTYDASLEHIRRGLTLGLGTQNEMEEVLRFHEAMLLTRASLFDQALQKYTWFAHKNVRNPALMLAIGLAALRRPLMPKDLQGDQQEVASIAGTTTFFWMRSEFKEAEEGFRGLLDRFSSAPNVHYLYASYLLPSRPDVAMTELHRELQINPGSAEAQAMIALLFVRHEDLTAALPFAQKAAADGPSTPMAQYIYGLVLSRTGDPSGSIDHLLVAAKLDPSNIEYHMALAGAYSRCGRTIEARRERMESVALAKEDGARVQ